MATIRPLILDRLASGIATDCKEAKLEIGVVIGPAYGAISLASFIALHLIQETGRNDITAIWAEKGEEGNLTINSMLTNEIAGKNILVAEDILTTGKSAKKVIAQARLHGGTVIAVSSIWNRGGVTAIDLDVPILLSLVNEKIEKVPAHECEQCKKGVPINMTIGHGAEFVSKMGGQPPYRS